MRRAVAALQADLDVAVVEDTDVTSGKPDDRVGVLGWAEGGREDQGAAGEGEARYRTLPVISKCARRFRAQQASLDSWQSGISLPYETVFSRSAGTPSETR